jgi:CheY-like chemotaxis protein
MLTETAPDVILLDLMMPDVSGIEVVQHVRASKLLKDIPVVVFTAAEMKEEELSAAGADRFITKPYSLEGLRRVVRTLIKESASSRSG